MTRPHLSHFRTGLEQTPVLRLSGKGQQTSSAARTNPCEQRAQKHQVLYERCALGKGGHGKYEEHGKRQTPNGPPTRKARKRHFVKPTTALANNEDTREGDAGKKAERTNPERIGYVGTGASGYQQNPQHHYQGRSEPRKTPGQSHLDRAAYASQPLVHYGLPKHFVLLRPMLPLLLHLL
jgi:hypothetical protein